MTIDQHFNIHNGEYVDYDHAFGNQCTDEMRAKVDEVDGFKPYVAIPVTGNAKDIFKNFKDNQYFKKVLNGPTNAPKKGDIVFFGTYPFLYGFAGHVGVCSAADSMNLVLFEQNYPTGSTCRFGKHSYKGCLGWLTRK